MRGDKMIVASVIDEDGNTHYHILPTRWVKIGAVGFALMLFLAVILGLMIINNKYDIENLRQKIQVHDNEGGTCCNANTSTGNK